MGTASGFDRREFKAGPFTLIGYVKYRLEGAALVIYIEGDGYAWSARNQPSSDPTPRHPVALELAVEDPSPNVLYLARPGQFGSSVDPECSFVYWTDRRFSEEVIAAMNDVVSRVVQEMSAKVVHLIGYSGGGAVAVLLAARRADIASLRTVAGNLDPTGVNRYHRVNPLVGSLDPMDVVTRIKGISQRHFIGGRDTVIPQTVARVFVEREGDADHQSITECIDAGHQGPWASRWQELLKKSLERF